MSSAPPPGLSPTALNVKSMLKGRDCTGAGDGIGGGNGAPAAAARAALRSTAAPFQPAKTDSAGAAATAPATPTAESQNLIVCFNPSDSDSCNGGSKDPSPDSKGPSPGGSDPSPGGAVASTEKAAGTACSLYGMLPQPNFEAGGTTTGDPVKSQGSQPSLASGSAAGSNAVENARECPFEVPLGTSAAEVHPLAVFPRATPGSIDMLFTRQILQVVHCMCRHHQYSRSS